MRANNINPGIGKYTGLREQCKREGQEELKSRHNTPNIDAPEPIDVPLPEKLLSKVQLSQIFRPNPMYVSHIGQPSSIFGNEVQEWEVVS